MSVFTSLRARLAWWVAPMEVRAAMNVGMKLLAVKIAASRLVDADERDDISGVDQQLAVLRDLGVHVEKHMEAWE